MKRKKRNKGKCKIEGCRKLATHTAYDSKNKLIVDCCESHADAIAENEWPEYVVSCPDCGCKFGVN